VVFRALVGLFAKRAGDALLLAPGVYKLQLADETTVDNMVVEGGEVTEVK
jgi:hypothetical protein